MSKKPLLFIALSIIILVFAYFYLKLSGKFDLFKKSGIKTSEYVTEEGIYPDWIEVRKAQQIEQSKAYQTFHQFSFENKQEQSGITFKHLINPDCNVSYKPVHYDHGNGLTIADVDNDGLLDIYFVSQVGKGELWKNNGDGTFSDFTSQSGLSITGEKSCVSASFGDIDNDGDPDLYITTIRDGNFLFENNGKGVFADISIASNTNYHGHSAGIVFIDYDLDGLLDIYLCNVGIYTTQNKENFSIDGEPYTYYIGEKDAFAGHLKAERFEKSRMYKNLGNNQFKNVSKTLGIDDVGWTGDAAIIDGNADGYPDLYVTNMQGDDLYYENQAGKKFIEKRSSVFPKTPWGSMGISVFDFNNNGMQDVYLTDMHSDMLGGDISADINLEKMKADVPLPEDFLLTKGMSIFGNAFYEQGEDLTYTEISDKINAENYWPWGLSNGDLNADGFDDVFIASSMNYPFRFAVNSVMLNENGQQFLDSEFVLGIEPRKQFSQPWFQLDCSGKDSDHFRCEGKSGLVTIWGSNGSRSSAIFDLDGDGDLDIVTSEFNDHPQVLISNLSAVKPDFSYVKVKLVGSKSNRNGIGATVKIVTSEQTYTKVMTGKSGYLAQSVFPLYFGLNEANVIEKIEVKWPSGSIQTLEAPEGINDLIVISEN